MTLLLLLLLLLLFLFFKPHRTVRRKIKSTTYLVKDINPDGAAELLASTKMKLDILINHISKRESPTEIQNAVQLLVEKHSNGNIVLNELDASRTRALAYNFGKGDVISLCLRECRNCDALTSTEKALTVAIHEITHSGIKKNAPKIKGISVHSEEFHALETYLISVAKEVGILGSVFGMYCGTPIN